MTYMSCNMTSYMTRVISDTLISCLHEAVPGCRESVWKSRVKVCCSVLQCVAVCCSVLQCVAVCCSVLLCAAVTKKCLYVWCESVLQCAGCVCCSVLRCVAMRCSKEKLFGCLVGCIFNRTIIDLGWP